MTAPDPLPPREPEIEMLARAARRFLIGFRLALGLAGVVAVAVGAARIALPAETVVALGLGSGGEANEIARHFVWLCAGLPLLAPVDWLFGRARWWALLASALLWVVPIWLPGDHEYGYVLRIFATVVAAASLLVWRTLWGLTRPATVR